MGRHSTYTLEVASKICGEIAAGRSLRAICKEDEWSPHISTVMDWLAARPEFAERYARAREIQADALVEECMEIVDDGSNDWMESKKPDNPGYDYNGEAVQRSKLRADQRKWWASKLRPSVYGDKLQVEHSGSIDLRTASYEELLEEMRRLETKGVLPALAPVIEAQFTVIEPPADDDLLDLV